MKLFFSLRDCLATLTMYRVAVAFVLEKISSQLLLHPLHSIDMRLDCSVGSGREIAHHTFKIAVTAELHHRSEIHPGLKQACYAGGTELVQPPTLAFLA